MWGGGGAVSFWPDTKSGGYDRVSGGPGYSTLVEFMHMGINRQHKRAAIIIKCGPKSYDMEGLWPRGVLKHPEPPPPPPPPPP